MTGVVLGIITALLWGSADILSSLAARYVGAWRVTLLAQASGCLALAGGGLFLSWRFPQEHFFTALPSPLFGVLVLHAIVLGALAAGGYVALYRSLAQGPLALVSPIIAANGAVTLLAAILFAREQVDLEEGLVLAVILLGVVLAALQTDDRQHKASLLTRSGIGWALMAMMGLGLLGFGIGASTHTVNAFFLLLCTRCWTLLFLDLAAHAFRPQAFAPPLRLKHLVFIIGAGSTEMAGLVFFSLDARVVTTGIAGVLASVNTVLPLVFGVLVYRERLGKRLLGVPLIVAGLAALSLPSTLRILVLQSILLTLLLGRLLWMTVQQCIQTHACHTKSAGHTLGYTRYALLGAGVPLVLLVVAMSTHLVPGIKVVSVPGIIFAMIAVVMVCLIHPALKYDAPPGSQNVCNENADGVLDEPPTPPEASWNLIIVPSRESQYTKLGSSTQQTRAPSLRWAGSPASRSIREQKKHGMWPRNTEVLLLSSRYGLSTPGALTYPLPTAMEVDPQAWLWAVRQQLARALACKPYSEIVVCVYPQQQAVFTQECFAPEQRVTILPAHARGGDALRDWILEHICGETQHLLPLAMLELSPTTLHLLWKHDIYSLWEVLERDRDQVLRLLNGRLECFRELELQLCRAGLKECLCPTNPLTYPHIGYLDGPK